MLGPFHPTPPKLHLSYQWTFSPFLKMPFFSCGWVNVALILICHQLKFDNAIKLLNIKRDCRRHLEKLTTKDTKDTKVMIQIVGQKKISWHKGCITTERKENNTLRYNMVCPILILTNICKRRVTSKFTDQIRSKIQREF